MKQFPGCLYYEPDDLGWNAVNVPALTTVAGKIVPGFALGRYNSLEVLTTRAGASTAISLDIRQSVDGVNVIGGGITCVSAIANADAYGFFDGTNALGVGLTVSANGRFAFFWPYFRIECRNTDAANAATMTIRLFANFRDVHAGQ